MNFIYLSFPCNFLIFSSSFIIIIIIIIYLSRSLTTNSIVGSIPSTMGQLSSLQYLYLFLFLSPDLCFIPFSLNLLSFPFLPFHSLSFPFLSLPSRQMGYNVLSGTIPDEMSSLSLQRLFVPLFFSLSFLHSLTSPLQKKKKIIIIITTTTTTTNK